MGSLAEWESMPWQEIKPMDQRLEFALRAQRCANFRALCREYGISPRVGYKWRYCQKLCLADFSCGDRWRG
jgi:hypothetical protein